MEYVKSVLLIDDNPSCNFIMSEFIKLTDRDIHVYTAESVEEAWEVLNDSFRVFPEVIYVDLNMPVNDGFDFIERYEKAYLNQHPDTKLFMLSSSLRPEDRHRAMMFRSVRDFVGKNEIDDFLQGTLRRAVA